MMMIETGVPWLRLQDAHKGVQPPVMRLMFGACHNSGSFEPFLHGSEGGMRYCDGSQHLDLVHAEDVPFQLRRPDAKEQFGTWASTSLLGDVSRLDDVAWDIATLAIVVFDWCGVDPRKRTKEYRQLVNERIRLLFRTRIHDELQLYLPDPMTGRRAKQPVTTDGPFLVEASQFFRRGSQGPLNQKSGCPDGYVLSLGEWARVPVREFAMMALYFRAVAQYSRGRQVWERQISTYLLMQLQNQSPYMLLVGDGADRHPIPQQPLRLVTILDGSHLPWRTIARNDPGRVIRQTVGALEQLATDKLIGDYSCYDGEIDGSDLPERGRLDAMLERRYLVHPGPLMTKHIIEKIEAKGRVARKASAASKSR
jgi:hypothetical protein